MFSNSYILNIYCQVIWRVFANDEPMIAWPSTWQGSGSAYLISQFRILGSVTGGRGGEASSCNWESHWQAWQLRVWHDRCTSLGGQNWPLHSKFKYINSLWNAKLRLYMKIYIYFAYNVLIVTPLINERN